LWATIVGSGNQTRSFASALNHQLLKWKNWDSSSVMCIFFFFFAACTTSLLIFGWLTFLAPVTTCHLSEKGSVSQTVLVFHLLWLAISILIFFCFCLYKSVMHGVVYACMLGRHVSVEVSVDVRCPALSPSMTVLSSHGLSLTWS